jgi:hypothetical protein
MVLVLVEGWSTNVRAAVDNNNEKGTIGWCGSALLARMPAMDLDSRSFHNNQVGISQKIRELSVGRETK